MDSVASVDWLTLAGAFALVIGSLAGAIALVRAKHDKDVELSVNFRMTGKPSNSQTVRRLSRR